MRYRLLSIVILMIGAVTAFGQAVTTSPLIVTNTSEGIVITYHADGGNRGMIGLGATAEVYAHTGVITSKSSSCSDWKYATTWGQNDAKYRLTYAGTDTWTLTIPSIRSFYGITDPTEEVRMLAFVFRSTDGREGKTAAGGDIMVQVFPDAFPASPVAAYPGGKPRMGAVENADGSVTFCLGAPKKTNAVVAGSWDNYSLTPSAVMNRCEYEGDTYFWATVPGVADGKDYTYYYIVDGSYQCADPYSRLVLDPFNDQYIPSSVYPSLPPYPSKYVTGTPVTIYNSSRDEYAWRVPTFKGVPQSDLIIYELLLRDFTGTEGRAYGNGTVKGAIDKLDYLKELGVNAIELLPIMEFNGNNSWGYNTNFYMAPDKAYGTPDDYRALIDGAHERGMAVILDIVFNQSDALHPWYGLYTRKESPFYNGSAPHSYSVLNDWNQDCAMVQQQWRDALDYWMTAYNVDGFRFDLVKGLGNNSSYDTPYDAATNTYGNPSEYDTNRYNATRVARMKALHESMRLTRPDAYFINENLAGAQEENDMAADGEANWANINTEACQYAMGWEDNSSLNRFYAPDDQRLWGSTVSYAESHDEERVAYKVITYGAPAVKNSLSEEMMRLGSLAAQMILTPGAHMIWQFEEMGCEESTKNSDGSNNTAPKRVEWNMLKSPTRKGLHDSYAELCAIRRDYAPMFAEGVATSLSYNTFTRRTLALAKGQQELYLVVNPAVEGTAVIAPAVNPVSGSAPDLTSGRFTLLSASYGVTPSVTKAGVSLPAGAYAVYGADLESGIDQVASPASPRVSIVGGRMHIDGDYTVATLHTLTGVQLPLTSALTPGLYIVTIDGTASKVMVK